MFLFSDLFARVGVAPTHHDTVPLFAVTRSGASQAWSAARCPDLVGRIKETSATLASLSSDVAGQNVTNCPIRLAVTEHA